MNIVQWIINKHLEKNNKLLDTNYRLVNLDFIYTNGLTMASAINEIKKIKCIEIWDSKKIAIFPDHFTPNKDIPTANMKKTVREWARDFSIKNYFEIGDVGIEHIQFIEKQFVRPGSIVIGGDSHSCTLGAVGILSLGVGTTDLAFGILTGKAWLRLPEVINIELIGVFKNELISGKDLILHIISKFSISYFNYKVLVFSGSGCRALSLSDRISICNMAVEGGAKTALFLPDKEFLTSNNYLNFDEKELEAMSNNMNFDEKIQINLNEVELLIACPDSPRNVKLLKEVELRKIKIDQVFVGSCTNGSIDDLRKFYNVIRGKRKNSYVRVIVIPATPLVYKLALEEGIISELLNFGAVVGPPTCGPCLGGHMGVIGDGEVCLATTNRNFRGRMGSVKSSIYLCSPAVAGYSAIKGYICGVERDK